MSLIDIVGEPIILFILGLGRYFGADGSLAQDHQQKLILAELEINFCQFYFNTITFSTI